MYINLNFNQDQLNFLNAKTYQVVISIYDGKNNSLRIDSIFNIVSNSVACSLYDKKS